MIRQLRSNGSGKEAARSQRGLLARTAFTSLPLGVRVDVGRACGLCSVGDTLSPSLRCDCDKGLRESPRNLSRPPRQLGRL